MDVIKNPLTNKGLQFITTAPDLYTGLDSRYLKLTGGTLTGGLTIQPATDTLTALVVNDKDANNVLTVDTINNRVGIGTTSPGTALEVIGNYQLKDAITATKSYRFRTSGTDLDFDGAGKSLYISVYDNADYTGIQRTYLIFGQGSNYVTAKNYWEWKNSSNVIKAIIDPNNDYIGTNKIQSLTTNGNLTLAPNGSGNTIVANGNVGIGITAPTAKLHIVGATDTQQLIVKGNATQTANLQEWQNSSETVLVSISGTGVITNSFTNAGATELNGATLTSTATSTGATNGLIIFARQNSSSTLDYLRGLKFNVSPLANGNITYATGVEGNLNNTGLGTWGGVYGNDIYVRNSGSGASTNMCGLSLTMAARGGSVTNMYGVYPNMSDGGSGFAGKIGSMYGFYLPAMTTTNTNTKTIAASGAVRASGTVTITTTATHNLPLGGTAVIAGVPVGATDFNGSFVIASIPTATTFTYTQAGTDETQSGGTAAFTSTCTNKYGIYLTNVSGATTNNYAIYTNAGDLRFMSTPTTDKLGFWGATPVVRPTAYTQTYATASKTMPNATAADLATTATTQLTPYGFATQAQGDNIATQFNLLRADLDATKKVLNQVLDDLQILGLLS